MKDNNFIIFFLGFIEKENQKIFKAKYKYILFSVLILKY